MFCPDLAPYIAHWTLDLQPEIQSSPHAVVAFGYWNAIPIVLKVIAPGSDEAMAAAILPYFPRDAIVSCLDQHHNALLLERARPGTPLTERVLAHDDDTATLILCRVIQKLHQPPRIIADVSTVEQWGVGFHRYLTGTPHPLLPFPLVERASCLYHELCRTQRGERLLHGDLHHDNILFDRHRDWIAIDPKGVIGEPEYETGAALRNPTRDLGLYADSRILKRRITLMTNQLGLDGQRIAQWCFSQGILSAIWALEDHAPEADLLRGVAVAHATIPLLDDMFDNNLL